MGEFSFPSRLRIPGLQPIGAKGLQDRFRHPGHGVLEDFPPLHLRVDTTFLQIAMGDPGVFNGGARFAPEIPGMAAVCMEVGRKDPGAIFRAGSQKGGAGTVAKEHSGVPARC